MNFKYLSLFACAFLYRLFIVLGSHLLFIRHHMRSGLLLGLQLLEGRNTLRVPEDVPPRVPGGTPISAWLNFYTPILHRGHLRVTGPGVPCLRFPGTDWRGVLGACPGCTHTSGATQDVPVRWASPTRCSRRACVYTRSPGSGPTHRAVPKERINLHLGPRSHSSS